MPIIVQHNPTGKNYLLVGTGFGAFRSSHPGVFLGNWAPEEIEGEKTMVAVCDETGKIRWVESHELTVVSIDGKTPAELL